MNTVCAVVGYAAGRQAGDFAHRAERSTFNKTILVSLLTAFCWAAVTGFFGGAIVFVIGGIVGAGMAVPVAVAGFPAFTAIHRLMERGSLIELKHLLPVALGISLAISAFILSLPN